MTTRNRELASIIDDSGNITTGGNLSVTGNLTQSSSTTTTYSDGLLELNNGAGSNSNDLGLVMERGSTGDNAIFLWDESNDGFAVGTTTATGSATGNISFSAAPFTASTITGTILNGSTSVRTPLIEFTDGDDALTIADGGLVTTSTHFSIGGSNNELRFYEGSNYVGFEAPALSADQIWVLPAADGSSGQLLKTDGSGNLSFTDDLTLANASVNNFTGDGSTTGFTLSSTPVTENTTMAYINGVYQFKNTYSVSGTTFTFDAAPANGASIEIIVWSTVAVNVPADSSVTSAKLSGDLTLPGDLTLADSEKVIFGAGSDLQLFHDGTNSYITNGTGILLQRADDIRLQNAAGSEVMIDATANGAVNLYHDSSAKLATTSTGIQVTGNIANTSGDLTLDVAGDIILDADDKQIFFKDNGTTVGTLSMTDSNLKFISNVNDKDMIFAGTDNNSEITALTLDMSAAGEATFNDDINLGDGKRLRMGAGGDFEIFHDGSHNYIKGATGDQDILFQGVDGSTAITALTLDMSDAGAATFNGNVKSPRFILNGTDSATTRYIFTDNTNTGDGRLIIQSGGGSAGYGGSINLYSHSHASKPGDVVAGISSSSGGAFRVNTSAVDGGSDVFVVKEDGTVKTAVGSNISTVSGSIAAKVHESPDERQVADASTGSASYRDMHRFTTNKSGQFRIRWAARNQSGSYYWAGRFLKNDVQMKKSDNSTDAIHYFGSSLASGESSSVHAYRTFEMDLGDVVPGDVIKYQMVSATGAGTPRDGNGQYMIMKNFEVYSTEPNNMDSLVIGEASGTSNATSTSYTGLQIGKIGIDDSSGIALKTQFWIHNEWHDICYVNDAGRTGVTFLLNAVRDLDQNRQKTALVRYAYNQTFTELAGGHQNTSWEYRYNDNKLQGRFTSSGNYLVQILVMTGG